MDWRAGCCLIWHSWLIYTNLLQISFATGLLEAPGGSLCEGWVREARPFMDSWICLWKLDRERNDSLFWQWGVHVFARSRLWLSWKSTWVSCLWAMLKVSKVPCCFLWQLLGIYLSRSQGSRALPVGEEVRGPPALWPEELCCSAWCMCPAGTHRSSLGITPHRAAMRLVG